MLLPHVDAYSNKDVCGVSDELPRARLHIGQHVAGDSELLTAGRRQVSFSGPCSLT